MSPIDGISEIRWFPRLGKLHLGEKVEGQRGLYPKALDHFKVPEEVAEVHGKEPKELPVMFPSDDLDLVAPQWYKCYSYSQGLICKGDGKKCRRKVDTKTHDFANRDTKLWVMTDGVCDPENCPMKSDKQCRKMMSLIFILHEVPGLGVYQLDTGSFYSIVNLNSQLAPDGFLRHFTQGRIAFIPLILSVEPKEVNPPGEGRKTVHVLNVRADVKLADIIRISRKRPAQVLLPTLAEEEPPEDLYPEELLAGAEETGAAPAAGAAAGAPAPVSTTETKKAPAETKPVESGTAAPGAATGAEEDKPPIDRAWLDETLMTLHWTEKTVKSRLAHLFPEVNREGDMYKVLGRLTRPQAELLTKELQDRANKVQPLFE